MLPGTDEPKADSNGENEDHDRTTIVHVLRSNRDGHRERKEDDDVQGIDKSEEVDGKTETAEIPLAKIESLLGESNVENAADGDGVAEVQSQGGERSDGTKGDVAGAADIEEAESADKEDGEGDGTDGNAMGRADVGKVGRHTTISRPSPGQTGDGSNVGQIDAEGDDEETGDHGSGSLR